MECSICTENINEAGGITLECNHTFHASCICNWFRKGNPSCPNCRDSGNSHMLNWPDSRARASVLRQKARNKCAPIQLKALVKKLQDHEQKCKAIRKEMREFRKKNIDVFKTWAKFRPKFYAECKNHREAIRKLGTFASPEFPLPNIRRQS